MDFSYLRSRGYPLLSEYGYKLPVIFYVFIFQLKQTEAEIQRLRKENEVFREKLKTAEEKNQNNIAKLKARIAEKEKEVSHKKEELGKICVDRAVVGMGTCEEPVRNPVGMGIEIRFPR